MDGQRRGGALRAVCPEAADKTHARAGPTDRILGDRSIRLRRQDHFINDRDTENADRLEKAARAGRVRDERELNAWMDAVSYMVLDVAEVTTDHIDCARDRR